jgi:hypothetical protein
MERHLAGQSDFYQLLRGILVGPNEVGLNQSIVSA